MRVLISFRSTLVLTRLGASASKRSLAGDGAAEGPFGDPVERVVKDTELRTELALAPGRVDRLEAGLPEAAPGTEQRVIEGAILAVFGP